MTRQLPACIALTSLVPEGEVVFPGRAIDLPTSIVHSNADLCGQKLATSALVCGPYHARRVELAPVTIHALPENTAVLGNNSFLVRVGDCLVAEQISPLTSDLPGLLAAIEAHASQIVQVDGPCLLVARYGEVTWGHWLAEILPAAAVAEHLFPGRFSFAVPDHTTHPGPKRDMATAVLESLAAYGIEEDRLIRLRDDREYRFASLHMMSGIWSAVLNPDVLALMRNAIVQPVPSPIAGSAKAALLRPEGKERAIFNHAQVIDRLMANGFTSIDISSLPFLSQVAVFRNAEQICGSLGSGLTGLIYAQDNVQLVSIGPADWFDFYFYTLIQQRDGLYADFRGPVVWNGAGLRRDGAIVVDPGQLDTAFAALRLARETSLPPVRTICGFDLRTRYGPGFFAIDFSAAGNAKPYLGSGWSVQEQLHIWSVGASSRIVIPRDELHAPPAGEWMAELQVTAFIVPPCLVARQLDVQLNGQALGAFVIGSLITINCRIPAMLAAGQDPLVFTFTHPVCPSANVLGAGEDLRELGIGFLALRLHALPSA